MDGRGVSLVRYAEMRDKRRRARKNAEKIMGKSYFIKSKFITRL